MTTHLTPDTRAPALTVDIVGGGRFDLAAQAPKNFTKIVFYRGYHCPVCRTYLQKLNGLVGDYESVGFSVIALSMDGAERATKSVEEWKLSKLKIGFGLSEQAARQWGLYISQAIKEAEADIFCEPGLFWVRADGRVYLVDISNMPWSRPDLEFLLSKVPFAVEKKYPVRGTA